MSKQIFMKYKYLVLFLVLSLGLPITVSYFSTGISYPVSNVIFLVINLALVFILINRIPVSRGLLIAYSVVLSLALPFVMIFILMNLPMQKEHDRTMWEVCMPEIRKSYGLKEDQNISANIIGPIDKKGNPKWWYQHLECEQNVKDGKGSVFSENPPAFIP